MEKHDPIIDYQAARPEDEPLVRTLALYVAVFCATGVALVIVIGTLYELLCWLAGHRL